MTKSLTNQMRDILQNSENDIDLSTGDLQFAAEWDATDRHTADIILSSQGDFKESPLVGVGSLDYINSELPSDYLRDVSIQLQRDGIKIKKIGFDANGYIEIDGQYENNDRN